MFSERAVFVTFKHSPQKVEDIIEWYKRIKNINKGKDIKNDGLKAVKEIDNNYKNMNEKDFLEIKKSYNIDYGKYH